MELLESLARLEVLGLLGESLIVGLLEEQLGAILGLGPGLPEEQVGAGSLLGLVGGQLGGGTGVVGVIRGLELELGGLLLGPELMGWLGHSVWGQRELLESLEPFEQVQTALVVANQRN